MRKKRSGPHACVVAEVSDDVRVEEEIEAGAAILAHVLIDEYIAYVERPPRWELLDELTRDWTPPTPTGFRERL